MCSVHKSLCSMVVVIMLTKTHHSNRTSNDIQHNLCMRLQFLYNILPSLINPIYGWCTITATNLFVEPRNFPIACSLICGRSDHRSCDDSMARVVRRIDRRVRIPIGEFICLFLVFGSSQYRKINMHCTDDKVYSSTTPYIRCIRMA